MTARAGAGGRYLYDYVQIMGIDMTQFDQMGYKLVGGEKPVKKDQVLAGEWFAYGFMDTLKNGEQRTSTRGGQYSSCTFDQTTGQCEEDQDEDPFFDPLATQISLTTGTNYQGDQYSMNMYGGGGGGTGGAGGGGGAGGASGSAAGQSENVTLDVLASGIVAGDYNKGYATSDGLVMDLQALKELAAKVDPAAAKKPPPMIKCWSRPPTSSPCPKSNHRSKRWATRPPPMKTCVSRWKNSRARFS